MGLRIKIELFTFPFVRAKIVKSAYFWLFVNEVILAAWNHLAHAQHEVFVSDPTWHPSEVRILLWLWCLQEVLRATKNLAKIIHKSIMNTNTLPTTEQLPDQPSTFLWAPGCTWKKTTRGQGREKRSVTILPVWPALFLQNHSLQYVGVTMLFYPLAGMTTMKTSTLYLSKYLSSWVVDIE